MNALLDLFATRVRLAGAVAIVSLAAGGLALMSLPVAFFPSVARPAISVSCSYPGANAREVMNTVAGPIEDRVNGVEGFDHMGSSCSDTGSYSLTVYFQAGFDRDIALMKVQAAVQQALTQLPQEVKNTGVTVGVGQTIDLGYVTCYSANGELTHDEIVDYTFGVVNPAIMRVQGVGAASVQDDKLAMRIWLDADRMAALGINTDEVVAAVKAQNVQASLGTVGASPVSGDPRRVITLVAKGRLHTPDEFGAIVVRAQEGGGVTYLRDIARIELGQESYAHLGFFGDKPACVIHLYQIPGANTLETIARVKKLLGELEVRFPRDLKWDMTVDISRYSRSALHGAQFAIVLSAVLALLILLVAFRSIRSALVAFAASFVAVALMLTVLAVTGYFITVLTLYALAAAFAFALGVSAAVVSAARAGRLREIRFPVLAACATVSVSALVLLLVGGVSGLILRQFAVVFAAAGVATGVAALLVAPAYACRGGCALEPERPIFSIDRGVPFPARLVAFGAVAALALATVALVARMPSDLVPNEDFRVILVDFKTREGTSRPAVTDVVRKAYERILSVCDVEKSCTVLGEGVFSGSGENVAKTYLVLKPWSERGAGGSTMETIARIRAAVADISEAEIHMMTLATVPGLGTQAVVSPLVLAVGHNDPVRLADEAHRLRRILAHSPLADSVTCGYNTDAPHLRIRVDRAKCELLQVPLASLFSALQHCLGSIYVNDINLGIQVNRVTLMGDWKNRADAEAMADLRVRSKTGDMVPVSTLVEFEEELGPRVIYRWNRYIYCTVDLAPKAGVSLGDAMDEIARTFARELPQDFDTGWSGIAYEESSTPGRQGLLIVLSVLAACLVLVVRFESWRSALATLLPTAAALFGAVVALGACGSSFSLYSRFALVALVVVNAAFSLFTRSEEPWLRRAALPLFAAALAAPLLFTTGAGEMGSRSFGLALVGGYLAYAFFGVPLARLLRVRS